MYTPLIHLRMTSIGFSVTLYSIQTLVLDVIIIIIITASLSVLFDRQNYANDAERAGSWGQTSVLQNGEPQQG